MVVPTLPVIGVPPSIELFLRLEALSTIIVLACVVATMVSFCVLVFRALLYCVNKCRVAIRKRQHGCCCRCKKTNKYCWTPGQRQRDRYHKCMKTVFEVLGRWLCVKTFPALFKLHKTRSRQDKSLRMVFLDREVESSVVLVVAFCCLAISILCISTLVFFQYFPVEESGICLEKDGYGRPLFCYINSSIPKYPNLPVDCANYTVTELRKIEFTCYVLAFPGLGIAVAAALGLAKMAAVAVTLYVKMTEAFFNMTKDSSKLPWWCCCRELICTYANNIYLYLSWALLTIVLTISPISIIIFITYDQTEPSRGLLRYYFASMLLPAQLCLPLMYIIHHLKSHCKEEEYANLAEDQKTPVPSDCDEESEPPTTAREQDEESRQRVNSSVSGEEAPGGNEEAQIIGTTSSVSLSTECTEFGATELQQDML